MCDWRNAVLYRNRAELLREIAMETDHVFHKQALMRVAEYYDAMAEALDCDVRQKPTTPVQ